MGMVFEVWKLVVWVMDLCGLVVNEVFEVIDRCSL